MQPPNVLCSLILAASATSVPLLWGCGGHAFDDCSNEPACSSEEISEETTDSGDSNVQPPIQAQAGAASVGDNTASCELSATATQVSAPDCAQCLAVHCCAEANACAGDPDCVSLVSCTLTPPLPSSCLDAGFADDAQGRVCLTNTCDQLNPAALEHYFEAFRCIEGACPSECADLVPG